MKELAAPLTKAVTRAAGGGVGERAASLAGIGAAVARVAGMRGRDPLRRLRKKLLRESSEFATLEQEVEQEVRRAVEAALASLGEGVP